MGEKEKARAQFQALINLLPDDHPEAIDSRERLENLNK
jgi:hypothetical protein